MLRTRLERPLPSRALVTGLLVLVLATFAVLSAARPAGACACGIAYGTTAGTERALLSLQGGREDIVLGLDLAAPGESADSPRRPAVLLPVPATPTVAALSDAQASVFGDLELATRQIETQQSEDSGEGATAGAPDVSVLSRERIGGYDVTRLRAGDAAALRRWLNRGGYRTPAAAEPVLRDYVRRGWAFVAIRLADRVTGSDGTLSPLRVSFAARSLVYPLRLSAVSTHPVSVELFVAGEHRVLATGFNTYFAGFVQQLRPVLPAAVRTLVRGRYLTRLGIASSDPKAITSDVHFRQGVSDRLFRASSDYPYETPANFARGPLPSELQVAKPPDKPLTDAPGGAAWLLLFPGIGLAVVLVFLALRLRERLRRRA